MCNTAIDMEESRIPDSLPHNTSTADRSTDHSPAAEEGEGGQIHNTSVVEPNGAAGSTQAESAELLEGDGQSSTPISKNQLKKLKRQRVWEERKGDRKRLRKERKQDRTARKRAEREEKVAAAEAAGLNPEEVLKTEKPSKQQLNPVPVAFILDCDFEEYMRDPEIVSLSSQVVRSYSQNRHSSHQAHLFVSSFKGKMKTRFETVLSNSHKQWKGTYFIEEDFREAAKKASELMAGPDGGELVDVLRTDGDQAAKQGRVLDTTDASPVPESEPVDVDKSVVYLSSESPYTLEKLEPYTSYVIGGLVDRNREKGLCYSRAREMKVRTAKLPIGEYMAMQSRYVLTTNQVVEIMSKWLECGDWGEAFLGVMPKRKGGVLKGQSLETQDSDGNANGGKSFDHDQQNGDSKKLAEESAHNLAPET